MGNRAVIVSADTNKSNADKKIGIYVHWHGDEDIVEKMLSKAAALNVRCVDEESDYFWARFCQIFANYITESYAAYSKQNYETGIGIDIVSNLDTNNGDNGVYYVDGNFSIVKHTDGKELL